MAERKSKKRDIELRESRLNPRSKAGAGSNSPTPSATVKSRVEAVLSRMQAEGRLTGVTADQLLAAREPKPAQARRVKAAPQRAAATTPEMTLQQRAAREFSSAPKSVQAAINDAIAGKPDYSRGAFAAATTRRGNRARARMNAEARARGLIR
jgi:hypothetical protein